METWHPLGVVGVICAFNFPAAVWSWNTAVALVCGDTVVWKPSPAGALTAMACSALLDRAAADCGAPAEPQRARDRRRAMPHRRSLDSPDVALVSATGSERMGAEVAPRIAARFGRVLLELGGNNAAVVAPSADLELAARGITFAAAGTAGQRCTSMRRLIVHEDVADALVERLVDIFGSLQVGDPFDDGTLVGPLINTRAHESMVRRARPRGGATAARSSSAARAATPAPRRRLRRAGDRADARSDRDRAHGDLRADPLRLTYRDFDEAIALHNGVPQGLSSSIFTRDQREAERFIAADGSDCGIVNVNIGTSGAEIGGAFGGEKTTGGGRESGSDAWRAYMRRATNTINFSDELPLAQGVSFG